jgi:mycofactocin biosynthetic radical S-adenosylmethionine protein MftC
VSRKLEHGGNGVRYTDLIERTRARNQLLSVMLELTYRCNLDCFYCYNDTSLKGRPLGLAQYLPLLQDLRELETLYITFTGGEPLAHPEFFAIARTANEMGFVLRIKSNGHAIYGPLARRLKREVDPFNVDVSLHGACAGSHDRQTRVSGSFDRLLSNIREMLDLGIRVQMNCTLTRWNIDELEGMLAIADGFGIKLNPNLQVTPRDDGDREPLSIEASPQQKQAALRLLKQRQEVTRGREKSPNNGGTGNAARRGAADNQGSPHCSAGTNNLLVDPYGNVYPCVQWRRSIGNIHEASIKHIWEESTELAAVRAQNFQVRREVDDRIQQSHLMSFCPGMAYSMNEKPTYIYKSAKEQRDILLKL